MFRGLDPDIQEKISAVVRYPVNVVRGRHLVRSGTPFTHLYSVHDGSFKACADDSSGREHVWGFFAAGDLVGLHAVTTGRYWADFVALEDSRVAAVPFHELNSLFRQFPALFDFVTRAISQNIDRMERLTGDFTAEVRLAALLASLPRHFQPLPGAPDCYRLPMSRREVADYLRLAPETVSRALSRFVRSGWIRVSGPRITLLNRAQLEAIGRPLGEV